MSDEPIRSNQQPTVPSGIFEHWCEREGCEEWGTYGYQAMRSQPAHYFCLGHRVDGERMLGR